MHPESTNLIPEGHLRAFRREYFFRLASLSLMFLSLLLISAGIFLFPTHTYLKSEMAEREAELADLKTRTAAESESEFDKRLRQLSESATRIKEFGSGVSVTSTIQNILAVAHTGVTLSGISYTPASKTPAKMIINGRATNRDTLRRYQQALEGASFISGVNLPVSAYAKESNIDFAITLTLKP